MTKVSRRDFLKLATDSLFALCGMLGLAALLRFFDYQPDPPPPTNFDLGMAANYPPGSRTVIPSIPAILIHSKSGFIVLSLICTHLGCTVEVKEDGFACPCHGSLFDRDGNVQRGPASQLLQKLRLEESPAGNLIVHIK
jgi:nitrite reductase/ring-hydroxylating ferredoxin subunit